MKNLPKNLDTRRGRELVNWIVMNDNPGDDDPAEEVAGYLTVVMLSHVYDVPALAIAECVVAIRKFESEARAALGLEKQQQSIKAVRASLDAMIDDYHKKENGHGHGKEGGR